MTHSVGGHCGKCGAPFYVPTIWHGVIPPPPQPTCGCWNQGTTITTTTGTFIMNNMDEVLNDWLERVQQAALRFKCKVERDAPDCFVPSRELQELFDVLDEDMDTK